MNKFCEEFRNSFRTDTTAVYTGTSNIRNKFQISQIFVPEISPQPIPARSCGFHLKNEPNDEIFVTAPTNSNHNSAEETIKDTILSLKYDGKTVTSFNKIIVSKFGKHFPISNMVFDNTLNQRLATDIIENLNERDHRVLQDINIRDFCEEVRINSSGYLTRDINATPDKYEVKQTYLVHADMLWRDLIWGRSCQLLELGDPKKEIVVTASPSTRLFQPVINRVVLLTCMSSICHVFGTVIVGEFSLRYPVLEMTSVHIDESVTEGFPANMFVYHRILQNIYIRGFCNSLKTNFPNDYEEMESQSADGFRVTRDNILKWRNSTQNLPFRGRSCQLTKKDDLRLEILVTAPSYSFLKLSIKDLQNHVAVLSCIRTPSRTRNQLPNQISTELDPTFECIDLVFLNVVDLENFFPIIQTRSDNTLNSQLVQNLHLNMVSNHRILQNIDMATFCLNVQDYPRGLYIPRSNLSIDSFKVNKNNRMHNSKSVQTFISRSCNLLRIDNLHLEVFVAPLPMLEEYAPLHNRIVIVLCSNSLCHPETTLIFDNLKKTVPVLDLGLKFLNNLNGNLEIQFLIRPFPEYHRLYQTSKLQQFCEKLRIFSDNEYEQIPVPTKEGYSLTFDRILRRPYTIPSIKIPSRSCQLVKSEQMKLEIVISPLPVPDSTTNPPEDQLVLLGCINNMCLIETAISITNVDADLPINKEDNSNINPRLPMSQVLPPLRSGSRAIQPRKLPRDIGGTSKNQSENEVFVRPQLFSYLSVINENTRPEKRARTTTTRQRTMTRSQAETEPNITTSIPRAQGEATSVSSIADVSTQQPNVTISHSQAEIEPSSTTGIPRTHLKAIPASSPSVSSLGTSEHRDLPMIAFPAESGTPSSSSRGLKTNLTLSIQPESDDEDSK